VVFAYRVESQQFIECCAWCEGLSRAEKRLNEKIKRVSHYLDPKSDAKFSDVVERDDDKSHVEFGPNGELWPCEYAYL